jgi:DNA-binding PadR family transcriptional regulator
VISILEVVYVQICGESQHRLPIDFHSDIYTSIVITMIDTVRRSPLALAILALLYEEPMHPYRMQRVIKERGKDQVINVRQRTSLYQTIDRLLRAGLIAIQETTRDEKRPERTVYALTPAGDEMVHTWMREMLSTPAREFPEFPAVISFAALLAPEDVLRQLETRASALERELAQIEATFRYEAAGLPRIFLLESEYLRATLSAELAWVQSVSADLRTGQLAWSEERLRELASELAPPAGTTEGGGL